jgi:hypothetical protein
MIVKRTILLLGNTAVKFRRHNAHCLTDLLEESKDWAAWCSARPHCLMRGDKPSPGLFA